MMFVTSKHVFEIKKCHNFLENNNNQFNSSFCSLTAKITRVVKVLIIYIHYHETFYKEYPICNKFAETVSRGHGEILSDGA